MKDQTRYKARRPMVIPPDVAWPLLTAIVLVSAVAAMMAMGQRGLDSDSFATLVGLCVTYLGLHFGKRKIRRRKNKRSVPNGVRR